MVDKTILNGGDFMVYKPTYNWGASHCSCYISHMLHGAGIFAYIWVIFKLRQMLANIPAPWSILDIQRFHGFQH